MKRFISIIFFSGLLAFGVFCTVSAQEAPAVETKLGEIKEQIREEQEKIERLEEGIEEHKKRVRKSRTEEINLLSELEKIDSRLAKGRTRLTELKKELATQEKLIRKKIAELETVTEEKLQARKHIKRRLAAYYRMGEIGVLNATFSATGLPELLDFKEYFHHLVQYDQQVITDYKHKIDKITETKNALQREKDRMMQVIVQVKSQEEELTEIRKQRLTLLKRVNTEKRLYQRALEEIEQAAGRLNETIERLNR